MAIQLDNAAIRSVFARPRHDGCFEGDLLNYCRKINTNARMVVLAFAPKMAGTFLSQAAIYAVNGQLVRSSHANGGREGSFYFPTVLATFLDKDAPVAVTHVHMQAFNANRYFIEAFDLKPVIMVRSIPDALASFWDMMETTEQLRTNGFQCMIPENFLEMDRKAKANFMVNMFAPWYASYYATWRSFVEDQPKTMSVLHYSDFREDPAASLQKALVHSGFHSITRQKCEEAVERARNERKSLRFNKGVEGRGQEYFIQEHLMRIGAMLAHYPQLKPWMHELMGSTSTNVRYLARG